MRGRRQPRQTLYGHRDKGRAIERIVGAYAARAENRLKQSRSSVAATSQQAQEEHRSISEIALTSLREYVDRAA